MADANVLSGNGSAGEAVCLVPSEVAGERDQGEFELRRRCVKYYGNDERGSGIAVMSDGGRTRSVSLTMDMREHSVIEVQASRRRRAYRLDVRQSQHKGPIATSIVHNHASALSHKDSRCCVLHALAHSRYHAESVCE